MAGELFYPEKLLSHLKDIMEWKDLTLTSVYGHEPYTMDMLEEWLRNSCKKIMPFVKNTGAFLKKASEEGKKILFEAQLGSLRDPGMYEIPGGRKRNRRVYVPPGSGGCKPRYRIHAGTVFSG